jgi:hypothetical protein
MRRLEISVQTYHRWKAQYHSMRPEDVVALKNLRKENTRLKKIPARAFSRAGQLADVNSPSPRVQEQPS